jgi:predicted P-loop ATPase
MGGAEVSKVSHPSTTFIECLTGDPDATVLAQILPDHDGAPKPSRLFGKWSNLLPMAEQANALGSGVFITVNAMKSRRRRAVETTRVRALFVDGDDVEMPTTWALPPTVLHSRSNTRWAAFWVLADDMPLNLFRGAQALLSRTYGGDDSVGDLPRVMRLPGFKHWKNKDAPALYEIRQADELRVYPWREVVAAFGGDPDGLPIEAAEDLGPPLAERELPDDERQTLMRVLASLPDTPSKRHNAMIGWVYDAIAAGMPEDEVEEHASAYFARAGVERDHRREIRHAIRCAKRGMKRGSVKVRTPGLRPEGDFAVAVAEAPPLPPAAAASQADELVDPLANVHRNDKGVPHSTEHNAMCFLRSLPEVSDLTHYCRFTHRVEFARNPPWPRKTAADRAWADSDDIAATIWFQSNCQNPKWEMSKVRSAIFAEAARRAVHPVLRYLDSLTWDGVARLDTVLPTYWGAPDTAYHRAIGAKTLIAAVRRVRKPGCKVDTMLVLEGPQGIFKSRSIARLLPTEDWFTDADIDIQNKDSAQQIRGKWLVEMGEMHAMKRAEVAQLKGFLTRQVDRQRDAYARHAQDVPRQCIFIGTTNETEYLRDSTGGRRFWPCPVTAVRLDMIERDRDQLWAEAAIREKAGEAHWLDAAGEAEARVEQAARQLLDPWAGVIASYLAGKTDFGDGPAPVEVTLAEVAKEALGLSATQLDQLVALRISTVLRASGWERGPRIMRGAERAHVWRKAAP